jgi:phosphatidylinositol alpha-mannosyltransferase
MVTETARKCTRPLRVCLVVPYDLGPKGGGVKQHAVHLGEALTRLGDDVTIIGPSSSHEPLESARMVGFRGVVNIPSNGSDNMLGIFVSPRKVWKFFRERPFDVIHVHEPQSPALTYWTAWSTPKTPHVATFHAYSESNSAALVRKVCGAALFPWFQRAIAVSPSAARYASAAWSKDMAIIPNGVPTRLFIPTPVTGEQQGPVKLLFVGSLGDTRKGARYLFDAYARLEASGAKVSLDVVGALGSASPPPELPGLKYWGEVGLDDLVAHYRACDVLVAPSTGQESFGIILLEAMASAKPVVCSDIDGYRGVIGPDGASFVPPGDVPALEAALANIVTVGPWTRQNMGQANLRKVQMFDWDYLVHRIRGEYLAAMGEA